MRRAAGTLVALALLALPALTLGSQAAPAAPAPALGPGCDLQAWYEDLLRRHPEGTAVPLKWEPTDEELAALGLPPADVLRALDRSQPLRVRVDGSHEPADPALLGPQSHQPTLAAYAGAGCLGIRPGGLLLNLNGGIAICSLAHVYGAPGSYQISTAGHCTKAGEVVSMVAFLGHREGKVTDPVVLDFGSTKSSHDNGIGDDWALISVFPQYQSLVTPTMCAWGGPRGSYTLTGAVANFGVGVKFTGRGPQVTPSVDPVNPNPLLAQAVLHYGHGTGLGTGVGTPRSGLSVHWGTDYFVFHGAISPGDSGSGANVGTGDVVGAHREGAGIITHLVVGPLLNYGVANAAGTRVTAVPAPLADGQLAPYPAPIPIAP